MRYIASFGLSLIWFLAICTVGQGNSASTSTLRGNVYDETSGEPLPYTYLHIEELNRTAAANMDGTYEFNNVPAGRYTLTTYRIGYTTVSQRIEIPDSGVLEIDIYLRLTALSSDAIQIIGGRERSVGPGLENSSKNISGNELRQDLGNTLAKTLENVAGLSARTMGSAPARPVIRGLGGERVLILQDGERTGDVSAQSADHAVTVDPMAAERIEIARGPAALRYGSNAIGGVINIVRNQIATSLPGRIYGTGSLQGESVNSGMVAALQAGIPVGSFAIQADGNLRTASDIKTPERRLQNSGLLSTNDAIGLSYIRPWGYAGVAGSFYYSEYGVPPDPDGGHEDGVDIEMRKYQLETGSEIFFENSFIDALDFDLSQKIYYHREIESAGAIGTEFGLVTSNISLNVRHDSLAFFTSGSFGFWGEAKNYAVNGVNTPDSDSYSAALYLIEETDLGALHLEIGTRFDYNKTVPAEEDPDSRIGNIRERTFKGISSSVSAIYGLGRGYFLGTTLMYSFRAPSQEELYSEGPHLASYSYEIGNPDLNPERGLGKELFIRYRTETGTAEVAGFHNSFNNYIYPRNTGRPSIRFPSLNEYQFIGTRAQFYGVEVSGEFQLLPSIALSGNAGYTLARREITGTERELTGDTDTYQPLPMIPPLSGNLSIKYATQTLEAGVRTRWAADQTRTGDFEEPTNGYATIGLFGQYRFETAGILHTVSLNIDNLTNRSYRNHLSRIKELVPEPSRNISLLYRIYF